MRKNRFQHFLSRKFMNTFILIALTCIAAYALFLYNEIQLQVEKNEQFREYYMETLAEATPTPTPSPTPTVILMPEVTPTSTPTPEPTPKRIRPTFASLREKYNNDDIMGFIEIERTSIFYPVLQSEDNEYYLNHNIEKAGDSAGWIYLDFENDVSKEDKNTIIYGHNMNADIMFHSLRNYIEIEDFLETHKYITFNTIYDDYTWEIFSVYKTPRDFYYIQVIFKDNEFETLLNEMKSRSIIDTGVEVTKDDRILTLSTCSNLIDDSMYVINAKLVKKIDAKPSSSKTD